MNVKELIEELKKFDENMEELERHISQLLFNLEMMEEIIEAQMTK